MSDPDKNKARKRKKQRERLRVQQALEKQGHHSREKNRASKKKR